MELTGIFPSFFSFDVFQRSGGGGFEDARFAPLPPPLSIYTNFTAEEGHIQGFISAVGSALSDVPG
jgi:hypothetical protein